MSKAPTNDLTTQPSSRPTAPRRRRSLADSAASATRMKAPSMAPTLDLNPGERGPAVADTMVALATSVDEDVGYAVRQRG